MIFVAQPTLPNQATSAAFPIENLVNEVMNQVVLNNFFPNEGSNKKECGNKTKKECGTTGKNSGAATEAQNKSSSTQSSPQKSPSSTPIVYEKKPMHYDGNKENEYAKISFDVAGFIDEDITIQVDDDRFCVVSITGERTNSLGDTFRIDRRFRLDKKVSDIDNIQAKITDDGILEVIVPKKARVGPRVIKIGGSSSSSLKSTTKNGGGDVSSGRNDDKILKSSSSSSATSSTTSHDDKEVVHVATSEEKKETAASTTTNTDKDDETKKAVVEETKNDDDKCIEELEFEQI